MTAPAGETGLRGPLQMPPDFDWSLLFPEEAVDHGWMTGARCVETGPEPFFPGQHEKATGAKRVCQGCEVRAECLDYAMALRIEDGVWGGQSSRERRKVRGDLMRAVLAEQEPVLGLAEQHEREGAA